MIFMARRPHYDAGQGRSMVVQATAFTTHCLQYSHYYCLA